MKDILFFSDFAHLIENEDFCAFYHSLALKPIFVEKEVITKLQHFKNPYSVELFFNNLTEAEKSDYTELISILTDNNILISKPETDIELLNNELKTITAPHPYVFYFMLTDDCNFDCEYCFVRNPMEEHYQTNKMSIEIAQKGLDIFCENIAKYPERFDYERDIIFYGGEPLMNFKVLKYLLEKIAEYKVNNKLSKNIRLSMITNGSLITQEIAKCLKKYDVSVSISVDGEEKDNDKRVYKNGKKAFSHIMRGFNICKENAVNVNISCTLTQSTVLNFDNVIKSLVDTYNVTELGFNMLLSDKEITLPDWYNQKAADFIIDAFEIFKDKGIWEDRIYRKLKAFSNSNVYPFDCAAVGGHQMVVAPDGAIGVCQGHIADRKHFVSNVNEKKFTPETDTTFLEWNKRTPLNMPQCRNCIALGICGGGCAFEAENTSGTIWGLDERFCVHSKTTLNWLIKDLYKRVLNE